MDDKLAAQAQVKAAAVAPNGSVRAARDENNCQPRQV